MEIEKFLSLLSITAGLIASLFFCIGVVGLSRKNIIEISKCGFGGHNLPLALDIAKEKINFLFGFSYLFASFFLNLAAYLIPKRFNININLNDCINLTTIFSIFLLIISLTILLRHLALKSYTQQIEKEYYTKK